MNKPAWLAAFLIALISGSSLAYCSVLNIPDQLIVMNQTKSSNSASGQTDESSIAHVQKLLGAFTSVQGIFRKYVLVAKGLTDQEVVEVARQLHVWESETWYYLMDSDDRFDSMLTALPKTAEGDYSTWPAEYIEEHYIGRIMQEMRSDGNGKAFSVWKLEGGPSRSELAADL